MQVCQSITPHSWIRKLAPFSTLYAMDSMMETEESKKQTMQEMISNFIFFFNNTFITFFYDTM